MKLEANELRIGSLVSVKEEVLKLFLDDYGLHGIDNSFRVTSIDNIHVNILIDGLECEYYLSDLKPIVLTEKWFDENLNNESEWKFVGFGTRIIIQHREFVTIKLELSASNQMHVYFEDNLINIKNYAHQVQNIYFSLTNVEL